ncbi:MAG TPA: efflux transporter outer membrane subunit [Haliscomenobacter sp.]|nr:efflux transporter outer membrane subunit [Haliscomenobacter sp.]
MKSQMRSYKWIAFALLLTTLWGCKVPDAGALKTENKATPARFNHAVDSLAANRPNWRQYFSDSNLIALIDTALAKNQELNIVKKEIDIRNNEVLARAGEYRPFVNIGAGLGAEKVGRYTRDGAVEKNIEIKPGKEFPEPLTDLMGGVYASWELDVWHKLRNAKKAAVSRYFASIEGKNFLVTNLIAEIANSYYELMALDNQLDIINTNIGLQQNILGIIKQEKEAAKVTQLAVNRFEAQVLNTQNRQYEIRQRIVETENRINFLIGRFPQPVIRSSATYNSAAVDSVLAGLPSQLLANRPDIRQAELELEAAKIDISVAKANFYPSFGIKAGLGLQAFNPVYLINPESILVNLVGDMMAPLVNKNAIKATYFNANATQVQAVYNYERSILNGYIEVVNQLSGMRNFADSYSTKAKEVDILTQSINISNSLYRSARADYMEVLLTQREALESKMELIEIRMKQLSARVNVYRALGGGWY